MSISKKKRAKTVLPKYNLLVTYQPHHPDKSIEEVETVLNLVGEQPRVKKSSVEGVLYAKVSQAHKVIERLTKLCIADPNLFMYTHHYTPIDTWVAATITKMKSAMKKINEDIEGSWHMQIKKRHWDVMTEKELIRTLTQPINHGKVDLEHPQLVVRLEIVADCCGVSLIKPEEYLDVKQTKEFN